MSRARNTLWTRGKRRVRRQMIGLALKLGIVRNRFAPAPIDLLFGTRAIARFMNLSRKQARALVDGRAIPVFALGGVTCARASSIRRRLAELEGGQP